MTASAQELVPDPAAPLRAVTEAAAELGARVAGPRRRMSRRAVLTTLAVVVLGAVEVLLIRGDLSSALDALSDAEPAWIVLAVACTLLSMHAFARTQRRMIHAALRGHGRGRRLSLPRMVRLAYSANAVNMTLPAGSALSVGYVLTRLRGWGVPRASAGFAVLASGVLSSVTFGLLLVSGALVSDGSSTTLVIAAVVVVAIAAQTVAARAGHGLPIRSITRHVLLAVARLLDRIWARGATSVREVAAELDVVRPTATDWLVGGGFATLNWLADLGCLVAVTHAVGGTASASFPLLLAAYLAGMSASSVAFLPGGFGVVEVAMIVTLHAGGIGTAAATAAVLLYRVISCLLVVVIGWVLFVRAPATPEPVANAEAPSLG